MSDHLSMANYAERYLYRSNNRGKSVGKDKSLILYSLLVFCHSLDKHPNSLFICVFLVPFPSFSAGREAVTAAGEMIGVTKCLRFSVSFDFRLRFTFNLVRIDF